MDRGNMKRVTAAAVVIVVLATAIMLVHSLRRTTYVTLPSDDAGSGWTEEGETVLTLVEVTPETVQYAIETLSRPSAYRRTIRVEQLWSGGSGTVDIAVAVSGVRTRIDRPLAGDRVRRTITNGVDTWIWYDNETAVYTGPAGSITADDEQMVPTYEEILALPTSAITAADYRPAGDVNCIYVETAPDQGGYVMRYWVSVDTGLLAAAEKLLGEETVYRMGALPLDAALPTDVDFTLPDGSVVPQGEEP